MKVSPFILRKLFSPFLFRGGKFLFLCRQANQKQKAPAFSKGFLFSAERVGFEPTVRLLAQRFSRPPDSTALAPLRVILKELNDIFLLYLIILMVLRSLFAE